MAFDDRKTEPLVAAGCLSVVGGLLAPVVHRWVGGWWWLFLFVPPLVTWMFLSRTWWREERES